MTFFLFYNRHNKSLIGLIIYYIRKTGQLRINQTSLLFYVGSFLLFAGMMFLFLPHLAHEHLHGGINLPYLVSIAEGTIVSVGGILVMVYANRTQERKKL